MNKKMSPRKSNNQGLLKIEGLFIFKFLLIVASNICEYAKG